MIFALTAPAIGQASQEGSDHGTIFTFEPVFEDTFLALPLKQPPKAGYNYEIYHAQGLMAGGNEESPFYDASTFLQGTRVLGADGDLFGEMIFIEATSPDGDAAFAYSMYWVDEGPVSDLYFLGGTGKWYGITGSGKLDRSKAQIRTDGSTRRDWQVEWKVEAGVQQVSGPPLKDSYPGETYLWSIHSPHITDSIKYPGCSNNFFFTRNYQDERVGITDPEDPLYLAAQYWKGTAVRRLDDPDEVLCDTGYAMAVRPDGNVVFWVGTMWYGEGVGYGRFVGGTGKWRNINGPGISGWGERPSLGREEGGRADQYVIHNSRWKWSLER